MVVVHLPTKGDTVRHGALVRDNWEGRTILAVAFDDDDLGKHDFIVNVRIDGGDSRG